MIAQQKLLRVFTLIRLLQQRPGRTSPQLALLLGIDKRSVYRYVAFLKEVGYLIDNDPATGRYDLFRAETSGRPTLAEEEAELLHQTLTSLPPTHPLLGSIRQKLFLDSLLLLLADGLADVHQGQAVGGLGQALRDGRQVQLLRYHSLNSGTVADRGKKISCQDLTRRFLILSFVPAKHPL